MPTTKTLSTTTLNNFLVPQGAGGLLAIYLNATQFNVAAGYSSSVLRVGDTFKASGGSDVYGTIRNIVGPLVTVTRVVTLSGLATALNPVMTVVYPGYKSGIDSPLNSIPAFADKGVASQLDIQHGRVIFVASSDGGEFIGVTGAGVNFYFDDGGAFCGTRFIKNGGDGSAAWVRVETKGPIDARWFGAIFDGASDELANLTAAIAAANSNNRLDILIGNCLISAPLILSLNIHLSGIGPSKSIIKPHPSFLGSYLIQCDTAADLRGSHLSNLRLDSKGKNMIAPIGYPLLKTTCKLSNVILEFDGTTQAGAYASVGPGESGTIILDDVEVYSNSVFATSAGIKAVNSAADTILVTGSSLKVAGTVANKLVYGIDVGDNVANIESFEAENTIHMLSCGADANVSLDTFLGAPTVTNLFTMQAGFTGSAILRNMVPNGATGNTVNDLAFAYSIPASVGSLAFWDSEQSGVSAYTSSAKLNVTGNGLGYIIIFDAEVYDYGLNYNTSTGIFTAPKAGRYLVCVSVALAELSAAANGVINIEASTGNYTVYSGNLGNARNSANAASISGSRIVKLPVGGTIKINVTVSLMAGNTVDIEQANTRLQISYLGR